MDSSTNPSLITFIYVSMLCATFLATSVFVFFNWKKNLFGKMMSICLILISYGLFTSYNAAQGFFVYLPHLARTGYLVLLTITPLLFLILKKGIPNQSLRLVDFLHFAPTLLYFINYFSFFVLSGQEKIALLTEGGFITFDEGWFFPKYFVVILSLGQIAFYIGLTLYLVVIPSRRSASIGSDERKFIYVFFFYLILLFIPPLTSIYAGISGKFGASPMVLTYMVSQTIFFLILWGQPEFIYSKKLKSIPNSVQKAETSFTSDQREKLILSPLKLSKELSSQDMKFLIKVLNFFEREKLYLAEDFSQEIICSSLKLSPFQIRKVLKIAYSISFNDFVNYQRIKFLVHMLETSATWRNYTSASLARSIGFKSSNSLYISFKKYLNTTPKEFIDQLKYD